MKKIILTCLLISSFAKADMYYECKKVWDGIAVNSTSSAPQKVDLDVTNHFSLRLQGKNTQIIEAKGSDDYTPILQTQRMNAGEMEIATYYFNGIQCDQRQTGKLVRRAQIGSENAFEWAAYDCVCGED